LSVSTTNRPNGCSSGAWTSAPAATTNVRRPARVVTSKNAAGVSGSRPVAATSISKSHRLDHAVDDDADVDRRGRRGVRHPEHGRVGLRQREPVGRRARMPEAGVY